MALRFRKNNPSDQAKSIAYVMRRGSNCRRWVMDNCRVHLGPGISKAIEKARATLRYLPKYSPDLNPIELPYSKFKAFLRKLAARTVPALHRAIRSFLHILKPRECAHYYKHAGYAAI